MDDDDRPVLFSVLVVLLAQRLGGTQIRRFRQNSLLAGFYGMGLFCRVCQWLGLLGLRSVC